MRGSGTAPLTMYELLTIPAAADGAAEAVRGAALLRARAVAAAPAALRGLKAVVTLARAFVAEAVGATDDAGARGRRLDLHVNHGRARNDLGD